jgi:hypothetical protein
MRTDNRQVCNYAVLKFIPYPETGEFVNLGVVVHCASAGLLTSRVETTRHQRVANFFPKLDLNRFHQALAAMLAEVRRVEQLQATNPTDPNRGRALFVELVRPREGVFRFSESRTILTSEPQHAADILFERYITQFSAPPQTSQEKELSLDNDLLKNRRHDQTPTEDAMDTPSVLAFTAP